MNKSAFPTLPLKEAFYIINQQSQKVLPQQKLISVGVLYPYKAIEYQIGIAETLK